MKFFILGFLMMFGVAGGIENLPPDAGAVAWIQMAGLATVALVAMWIGVMDINTHKG